jgi:hypothetical protein
MCMFRGWFQLSKCQPCFRSVLPKGCVLSCIFCGQKYWTQIIFIKKRFLFMVGSVCHVKQFTAGSRNDLKDVNSRRWCQTRSPYWDCNRRNCAAGGRVDSTNRRIMIDSTATALGCSHCLAHSICMIVWSLRKRAHGGHPENWRLKKK